MCSIKERLFTSKERVKTAAPKAGNNAHLSARWQRWINLLGQKSQMYNICNMGLKASETKQPLTIWSRSKGSEYSTSAVAIKVLT